MSVQSAVHGCINLHQRESGGLVLSVTLCVHLGKFHEQTVCDYEVIQST